MDVGKYQQVSKVYIKINLPNVYMYIYIYMYSHIHM